MPYMFLGDSGTVVFDRTGTVTGEEIQYAASVTKNPIEGGGDINDHVVLDPPKLTVSGIVSSDAGRATLIAMRDNRDLITYRGVEAHDNLVITSLSISRTTGNLGGYTFKVALQRVTIATAAFVPVTGPTMSQMDADKPTTAKKSDGKTSSQGYASASATAYMDYVSQFYGPVSKGPSQPANPASAGYRSVSAS